MFNVRSEASVSDGLLINADIIVVPTSLRSKTLGRIHQDHQGITKCLKRLKMSVWWPEITGYVKRIVVAYEHFQTFKPSQPKEPLLETPLLSRPWKKLGVDICLYGGHNYLVTVDYYSGGRGVARKEYHNSSVRGLDKGHIRPFRFFRRNRVRQLSAICVVGIPTILSRATGSHIQRQIRSYLTRMEKTRE